MKTLTTKILILAVLVVTGTVIHGGGAALASEGERGAVALRGGDWAHVNAVRDQAEQYLADAEEAALAGSSYIAIEKLRTAKTLMYRQRELLQRIIQDSKSPPELAAARKALNGSDALLSNIRSMSRLLRLSARWLPK